MKKYLKNLFNLEIGIISLTIKNIIKDPKKELYIKNLY